MYALERINLSFELTKIAQFIRDPNLSNADRQEKQNRAEEILVLFGEDINKQKIGGQILKGRINNVKTAKNTKVSTVFAVMEIDQVIASHSATGAENPLYPQELQPRDRSRESSQAWVQKTSNSLDPESLGRSGRADTGAPIIGDDNVVESGNGRTMAIQLAYERGQADEYRDWLIEEADYFGFTPEQIESFKQPILVRIRTSEIDRIQFTVEANQDDKLSFSATERAKSDAKRLDDNLLALFSPGNDGDLLTASNQRFIQGFLKSLGETEAAQYITTEGKPTQALVNRIKAAMFSKAYNDDRLLEMMADQTKPELQNMLNALGVAAPKFIEAQAYSRGHVQDVSNSIVDGIETSLDKRVANAIIDAANTILSAKHNDQDITEYVKQQGLFGDLGEGVPELAVFLAKNGRSAKKMAMLFKAMAEFTEKQAMDSQNIGLFGDPEPVSIKDAINYAVSVLAEHYDAKTADMFDSLDSENPEIKSPLETIHLSTELLAKSNQLKGLDPQDSEYIGLKARIDEIIILLGGKVNTPLSSENLESVADKQQKINNFKFLTGEPVASIQSGQIKRDENGKVLTQAKNWMREYLENNRPDGIFNHPQIGEVQLSVSGVKNSLSHMSADIHVNALPAVPVVLENSVLLEKSMDKDGAPIENYIIAAPVLVDDERQYVVIRLKKNTEYKNKKPRFYIVAAEMENEAQKNAALTLKDLRHTSEDAPLTGGKNRLLNVLHATLSVNNSPDVLDSLTDLNEMDIQAHEAATSPLNDDPEPTDKQKQENNYKTGDFELLGLKICIENPEGSVRAGIDENGEPWSNKMTAHYGYIDGTEGVDGDEIDCFIKPGIDDSFDGLIYIIDQVNEDNELDEHKVIIGADDRAEAKEIYLSNYTADWKGLGKIIAVNLDDFKEMLNTNLKENST